jgi:hypothetical protein
MSAASDFGMLRRWMLVAGVIGLPVALLCARLQAAELWPQHGLAGWALGLISGGAGLLMQLRSIGRSGGAFMRIALGGSMLRIAGLLAVLVALRLAAPAHFGSVALATVGMMLVFMVFDVVILTGLTKGA